MKYWEAVKKICVLEDSWVTFVDLFKDVDSTLRGIMKQSGEQSKRGRAFFRSTRFFSRFLPSDSFPALLPVLCTATTSPPHCHTPIIYLRASGA